MLNIILFGPPGAGKSTQSIMIQEKYKLMHISTGDICRQEIERNTPDGLLAKKLINEGNFFPDELAYRMVERFLNSNANAKGFIYDGFPRMITQVKTFQKILEKYDSKVSLAIEIEIKGEEELVKRLLLRGQTSGRADDTDKNIVKKRLKIYNDVTVPIINYYNEQKICKRINGIGSEKEVFERICKHLDRIKI